MGRWKIYKTAKSLERGVESYFRKISRTETVTEPIGTGRLDRYGHEIMEWRPVLNDDREEIRRLVYHVPPTRGDLCTHLGISRDTWRRYCDPAENPKFAEITQWAEDQLINWRDGQLHIRDDKHIKGLIHDMAINYGAAERKSVDVNMAGGQDLSELSESQLRMMLARAEQEGGRGKRS